MAVRYSGDVEVRVHHLRADVYVVKVRAPGLRDQGTVRLAKKPSPATYDALARAAIRSAVRTHGRRKVPAAFNRAGTVLVERVFRSPCPLLPGPRRGRS